jgi:hypothetical protein
MRIYLAAAMTNPERELEVIQGLLAHIEGLGHQVPTRHVASHRGRMADAELPAPELARRDLAWLAESNALIAEVSVPSHGVGAEVMAALDQHLPVLLVSHGHRPVSRLLLGLPGVRHKQYLDVTQACAAIDEFLASIT